MGNWTRRFCEARRMKIARITKTFFAVALLLLCMVTPADLYAQKPEKNAVQKTKNMTKLAKGTFEVKMTPQANEGNDDKSIGRLLMTKLFIGDLEGTSQGQMLGTQSTALEGSGGYVAMERFSGVLGGRKGSFILQHIGTMQGGKFDLNVAVVPDSGSGELAGISGKLKIIIDGAKHLYEFEYLIPEIK